MSFQPLSDFCDFIGGGRHKLSGKHFTEEGFPAFGAGGMNGLLPTFEFDRDGIVLSAIGARCGKCFLAEGKWSSLANTQVIFPDPEDADIRFLWYQLNDEARWPRRGAAQPFIRPSDAKAHKVYFPPLPEQRRIAGILDATDALRRRRRRAIETLDTLQGALFAEIFGDQADVSHIPLHELCRPKQWKTIPKSGMTDTGFSVYGANGKIGFYSEFNHSEPTILVTCRGATCGEINICEPQSYVTGNAMALDNLDKDRMLLPVLEAALRVRGFHDAITGTAQPQITRQSLQVVTVPVPPMKKQEKFMRLANSHPKSRTAMTTHLAHLDALFAALQSRAFAGAL